MIRAGFSAWVLGALLPLAAAAPPSELEVCLSANGSPAPLDGVFRTGDRVALSLRFPEAGHVYVYASAASGALAVLHPAPGEASRVEAGQTLRLPPAGEAFVFQEPPGVEELYVLWSKAPLEAPERGSAVAWAKATEGDALAWAGTKSLVRLQASAPKEGALCGLYAPKGDGQAWVIDLVLDHRGPPG